MKRLLVVLMIAAVATTGFATFATADHHEKKGEKKAKVKEERWSGTIQRSNKDASTLTVRRGNIEKTVVYDSSTKWTKGEGSAEMAEFKDGARVIVLGKYDEKGRLVAARVDLRPPR